MGTKLELRVDVDGTDSSNLQTNGEIYEITKKKKDEHVVVAPVVASEWAPARFMLPPGTYQYRFHVERDGGKFKVQVVNLDDDDEEIASEDYDTSLGFAGKVLDIEVEEP